MIRPTYRKHTFSTKQKSAANGQFKNRNKLHFSKHDDNFHRNQQQHNSNQVKSHWNTSMNQMIFTNHIFPNQMYIYQKHNHKKLKMSN